jgi:glycosyltransferase involved in cell wall biosynthesis
MKFSVVIPLFNKARYIERTIASVLDQTMDDFEIVVVDDGSTDDGAMLVQRISDSRIRVIKQKNSGVSAARNNGIAAARGEWIAFLDADDWHHPQYLETLLKAQSMFPDAETIATHYIPTPHGDGIWPPAWPSLPKSISAELIHDLPRRWMGGRSMFISSTCVKASVLNAMQPCFAVGEAYGEDLDLIFRLSEHGQIALINCPMVAYRCAVEGSLTTHFPKLVLPPFVARMEQRALSGELSGDRSRSTLWFIAQTKVTLARQALLAGSRSECANWLVKARRAATGRRWWMTVVMAMFFPNRFARSWQLWRVNRGPYPTGAADAFWQN